MFAVLLLHIHRVDRFDRRRIDASLCSVDQSIISSVDILQSLDCNVAYNWLTVSKSPESLHACVVLLLTVICVVDRMFKCNGFVEKVKSLCARSLELLPLTWF